MARAWQWSRFKTIIVTIGCGIAHVISSVILGLVGVALGIGVSKLEEVESSRGDIAAWLLIIFGAGYLLWGLYHFWKKRPHQHWHLHKSASDDIHQHPHTDAHQHTQSTEESKNLTPWILLLIFVFGPCEPLIPILMYPAAKNNWFDLSVVTGVFAVVTIGTMLIIVLVSLSGLAVLPTKHLERYTHLMAGGAICLCGFAIKFLGL